MGEALLLLLFLAAAASVSLEFQQDLQCYPVLDQACGDLSGDGGLACVAIVYTDNPMMVPTRRFSLVVLKREPGGQFLYDPLALPLGDLSSAPLTENGMHVVPSCVVLHDFDGDGLSDVYIGTVSNYLSGMGPGMPPVAGADFVFLNKGNGTFDTAAPRRLQAVAGVSASGGFRSESMVVLEDGVVITCSRECHAWNADLTFAGEIAGPSLERFTSASTSMRTFYRRIVAADVNGDGLLDFIVPGTNTRVWLREANSQPKFVAGASLGSAVAVAAGSIFGSKAADVVTIDQPRDYQGLPQGGFVKVFRNSGAGALTLHSELVSEAELFQGNRTMGHDVRLVDINGDSRLDIVTGEEEVGWGATNKLWLNAGGGIFKLALVMGSGGVTRKVIHANSLLIFSNDDLYDSRAFYPGTTMWKVHSSLVLSTFKKMQTEPLPMADVRAHLTHRRRKQQTCEVEASFFDQGTADGTLEESYRPSAGLRVETRGFTLLNYRNATSHIACGGDRGFTIGEAWVAVCARFTDGLAPQVVTHHLQDISWKKALMGSDPTFFYVVGEVYPTPYRNADFRSGSEYAPRGIFVRRIFFDSLEVDESVQPAPLFWATLDGDTFGGAVILPGDKLLIVGTARASNLFDSSKRLGFAQYDLQTMALDWKSQLATTPGVSESIRQNSDCISLHNTSIYVACAREQGALPMVAVVHQLSLSGVAQAPAFSYNVMTRGVTPFPISTVPTAVLADPASGRVFVAGFAGNTTDMGLGGDFLFIAGVNDAVCFPPLVFKLGGFSTKQYLTRMRLQPNGRVLVAGGMRQGNSFRWAMGRFLSSGVADLTFSGQGFSIQPWGPEGALESELGDMLLLEDGRVVTGGYEAPGITLTRWNTLEVPSRPCGLGPDCVCVGAALSTCSVGAPERRVSLELSGDVYLDTDVVEVYGDVKLVANATLHVDGPLLGVIRLNNGTACIEGARLVITGHSRVSSWRPVLAGATLGGWSNVTLVEANDYQRTSCEAAALEVFPDNQQMRIFSRDICPLDPGLWGGVGLVVASVIIGVLLFAAAKRAKSLASAEIISDMSEMYRTKALASDASSQAVLGDRDIQQERSAKVNRREKQLTVLRVIVILIEVAAVGLLCYAFYDFYDFKASESETEVLDFFNDFEGGFSRRLDNVSDPGVRFFPPRSSSAWSNDPLFARIPPGANLDYDRGLFAVEAVPTTNAITGVLLVSLCLDVVGLVLLVVGIVIEICVWQGRCSPNVKKPQCCNGKRIDIFVWLDVFFCAVAIALLGSALIIAFTEPVVVAPEGSIRGVRMSSYDALNMLEGLELGNITGQLQPSVPASLECFFEGLESCQCDASSCTYSSGVSVRNTSAIIRLASIVQGSLDITGQNVTSLSGLTVEQDLRIEDTTLFVYGRLLVKGSVTLRNSRLVLLTPMRVGGSLSFEGDVQLDLRHGGELSQVGAALVVTGGSELRLLTRISRINCTTLRMESNALLQLERAPASPGAATLRVEEDAYLRGRMSIVIDGAVTSNAALNLLLIEAQGQIIGSFEQTPTELIDWLWHRENCALRNYYTHRLYSTYTQDSDEQAPTVCIDALVSGSVVRRYFSVRAEVMQCSPLETDGEFELPDALQLAYAVEPLDGRVITPGPMDKWRLQMPTSGDTNQIELDFSFRSCRDPVGYREEAAWLAALDVFPDWLWTVCPRENIVANDNTQCHVYTCRGSMLVPQTLSETVSKAVQDNVIQGISLDAVATCLGLLGVIVEHVIIRRLMLSKA